MTNCSHELSVVAAKGAFCVLCRQQLTDEEYRELVTSENSVVTFIIANKPGGWGKKVSA